MRIAIVHPSLRVKGGAESVVVWLAEGLSKRGHEVVVFTTDYDDSFYGDPVAKGFRVEALAMGGYSIRIRDWIKAGWVLRGKLDSFDLVNPHNFPSYVWVWLARSFRGFRTKSPRFVWYCEEPFRFLYADVTDKHSAQLAASHGPSSGPVSLISSFLPALRRRGPKVIFSVFGALRVVFARRMERLHREPMRKVDRAAVRSLSDVLANSDFIAGHVRQIFRREAKTCYLGLPDGRFPGMKVTRGDYVLTVSRLFPEKNVGTSIDAMAMAISSLPPETRFLIAGTGPLSDTLKSKVQTLGLSGRVELLGFVEEDELQSLFAGAGVILYIPLDETFGLVYLEAAAARKAVIGPDHGGPAELIVEGETGLRVDALDASDVCRAILTVFEDREATDRMGEAGHLRLLAEFTFDKFLDRFESMVLESP